jgi:hypothetical protein
MPAPNRLFLHEEALLLALRDDLGTTEMGAWYQQAVGGAVLAELLLERRLDIVDDKVVVLSAEPVGDPLIDRSLERIRADGKRRTLQHWIGVIANEKDLKHDVARGLVRRGVLRADEDKVLLIFTRKIYPERDPKPERAVLERLTSAIKGDGSDLDPRTVVLLSLASATGLLRANVDRQLLKRRKARIETIARGDATGNATKELVEATTAAIAAIAICCIPATIHS